MATFYPVFREVMGAVVRDAWVRRQRLKVQYQTMTDGVFEALFVPFHEMPDFDKETDWTIAEAVIEAAKQWKELPREKEGMKMDEKLREQADRITMAQFQGDATPSKIVVTKAPMQKEIEEEISHILMMLLGKNAKYGNSALEPPNIFSKLPAVELINARIDDKLARIKAAVPGDEEDPELDLIGYLILKRIARKKGGKPSVANTASQQNQ